MDENLKEQIDNKLDNLMDTIVEVNPDASDKDINLMQKSVMNVKKALRRKKVTEDEIISLIGEIHTDIPNATLSATSKIAKKELLNIAKNKKPGNIKTHTKSKSNNINKQKTKKQEKEINNEEEKVSLIKKTIGALTNGVMNTASILSGHAMDHMNEVIGESSMILNPMMDIGKMAFGGIFGGKNKNSFKNNNIKNTKQENFNNKEAERTEQENVNDRKENTDKILGTDGIIKLFDSSERSNSFLESLHNETKQTNNLIGSLQPQKTNNFSNNQEKTNNFDETNNDMSKLFNLSEKSNEFLESLYDETKQTNNLIGSLQSHTPTASTERRSNYMSSLKAMSTYDKRDPDDEETRKNTSSLVSMFSSAFKRSKRSKGTKKGGSGGGGFLSNLLSETGGDVLGGTIGAALGIGVAEAGGAAASTGIIGTIASALGTALVWSVGAALAAGAGIIIGHEINKWIIDPITKKLYAKVDKKNKSAFKTSDIMRSSASSEIKFNRKAGNKQGTLKNYMKLNQMASINKNFNKGSYIGAYSIDYPQINQGQANYMNEHVGEYVEYGPTQVDKLRTKWTKKAIVVKQPSMSYEKYGEHREKFFLKYLKENGKPLKNLEEDKRNVEVLGKNFKSNTIQKSVQNNTSDVIKKEKTTTNKETIKLANAVKTTKELHDIAKKKLIDFESKHVETNAYKEWNKLNFTNKDLIPKPSRYGNEKLDTEYNDLSKKQYNTNKIKNNALQNYKKNRFNTNFNDKIFNKSDKMLEQEAIGIALKNSKNISSKTIPNTTNIIKKDQTINKLANNIKLAKESNDIAKKNLLNFEDKNKNNISDKYKEWDKLDFTDKAITPKPSKYNNPKIEAEYNNLNKKEFDTKSIRKHALKAYKKHIFNANEKPEGTEAFEEDIARQNNQEKMDRGLEKHFYGKVGGEVYDKNGISDKVRNKLDNQLEQEAIGIATNKLSVQKSKNIQLNGIIPNSITSTSNNFNKNIKPKQKFDVGIIEKLKKDETSIKLQQENKKIKIQEDTRSMLEKNNQKFTQGLSNVVQNIGGQNTNIVQSESAPTPVPTNIEDYGIFMTNANWL